MDSHLPLPEPTFKAEYTSEFKGDAVVQVTKDTRVFTPFMAPADDEDDIALAETKQSSNSETVFFNWVLSIPLIVALNMPILRQRHSALVPPTTFPFPLIRLLSALVTDLAEVGSTLVSVRIPEIRALLDNCWSKTYQIKPFTIWISADHDFRYKAKMITYISTRQFSIGFALMKGEYDDKVPWPFDNLVAFKLVNTDDSRSRKRAFLCNIHSVNLVESLARPTAQCNPALGFLDFISSKELDNGFIDDDSLMVIARFTHKDYVPSSNIKIELPNILPD